MLPGFFPPPASVFLRGAREEGSGLNLAFYRKRHTALRVSEVSAGWRTNAFFLYLGGRPPAASLLPSCKLSRLSVPAGKITGRTRWADNPNLYLPNLQPLSRGRPPSPLLKLVIAVTGTRSGWFSEPTDRKRRSGIHTTVGFARNPSKRNIAQCRIAPSGAQDFDTHF